MKVWLLYFCAVLSTALQLAGEGGRIEMRVSDTSLPQVVESVSLFHYIDQNQYANGDYAVVSFWVSETGETSGHDCVDTNNPKLGAMAIESLKRFRFSPGRKNGEPVKMQVRQRFFIDASRKRTFVSPCTSIYLRASCWLTNEVRKQPEVKKFKEPKYPMDLWSKGVSGYSCLKFAIDVNGKVSSIIEIDSSHEAFAREAKKALAKCRYVPASDGVDPIRAECIIKFRFVDRGFDKREYVRDQRI